jgi:DNA polymerase-3 subunit gamma/tau
MSYQVLARRWRPLTFDAVVGQAPIVRTLQNALAQERIAHAYLFAGPRGVGKTTTARLPRWA